GAFLQGGVHANAAGGLSVAAADAASISALIVVEALGVGLVGGSFGVSLTQNQIADDVTASLGSSTITPHGHDVSVSAASSSQISGHVIGTSETIAIGVAGAGCDAESRDDSTTEAFVGNQANLTLNGGSLTVSAASATAVKAEADGGALGIVGAGDILSDATATGQTRAFIGEGSTVTARAVTVSAHSQAHAAAHPLVAA